MSTYNSEVIRPGDRASALAKEVGYSSHNNNASVEIIPRQPDNFRGPVDFSWNDHILSEMMERSLEVNGKTMTRKLSMGVENDGAGGKPQFFTLVGTPEVFQHLGWEIITMTADDFARSGRFPAVIANEINTKYITDNNYHLFEAMMLGYGRALEQAGLVNITGETAVMKNSITAFCDANSDDQLILTWGATCIGLTRRDMLIDGSRIKPRMPIIGLGEHGYRCNGGGFYTEMMVKQWGPDAHLMLQCDAAREFAQELTIPSTSYARAITSMIGWNDDGSKSTPKAIIHGAAHITGGGVWGKLPEALPNGIGAFLHSMPEPNDILELGFRASQWQGNPISEWEAYRILHGGTGMLLIAEDEKNAETVIEHAASHEINAFVVGETIESTDKEIIITSKFGKRTQKMSSLTPF